MHSDVMRREKEARRALHETCGRWSSSLLSPRRCIERPTLCGGSAPHDLRNVAWTEAVTCQAARAGTEGARRAASGAVVEKAGQ